jgi:hypothetical protein
MRLAKEAKRLEEAVLVPIDPALGDPAMLDSIARVCLTHLTRPQYYDRR